MIGSALVSLVLGAASLSVVAFEYRRTGTFVSPLVVAWAFFGYFYLLAFVQFWYVGERAYAFPFDSLAIEVSAVWTITLAFLGMVSLTVGYYSSAGRRLGDRTVDQLPEARLSPSAGRRLGGALYALGFVAFVRFVLENGGFATLARANNVIAFRSAPDTLRYWLGLQVGLFGGLALYLSACRGLDRSDRARGLLIGIVTVVIFFLLHSRSRIAAVVLVVGWFVLETEDLSPVQVVGGAVSILLVYVLYRPLEILLRGQGLDQASSAIRDHTLETGKALVYPDYFQGFAGIVAGTPGNVDYQWGRTFVGAPSWVGVGPLPNLGNAGVDPFYLTEVAIYGHGLPDAATAAGGFGVLYLNFGWPGVLLGMFVVGVLCRLGYEVWNDAGSSVTIGALYALGLYYLFVVFTGEFLSFELLATLAVVRTPLLVVSLTDTVLGRSRDSAAARHQPWRRALSPLRSSGVAGRAGVVISALRARWSPRARLASLVETVRAAWENSGLGRGRP